MVFASWNDETGGTLYRVQQPDGKPQAIYAAPSQLANPAFSPDGSSIVFVQGSGANLRGQDLGNELRHDRGALSEGLAQGLGLEFGRAIAKDFHEDSVVRRVNRLFHGSRLSGNGQHAIVIF